MNPSDPFGLVGQVLDGQFRVEKLVGEGGFSAVYRGHHLGLDEPVAIKCLKLPPALGPSLVDSFVQRFKDESRILYRLSQGNLHIVRSIGAGATKTTAAGIVVPYMVLEWLEGRSMANEFTARRTLGKTGRPLEEVVSLFASGADALSFAHAQGVVHRDLNPGNLFLTRTPQGEKMKVLDFGVAKILDDATLNLGPRVQTMGQIRIFAPAYGAPEQFDDALGKVNAPADVYSFSLVLLEALRDRPVNDGTNIGEFATAAIDPNKRPTPRSLGMDLPEAVEQVFVKATKLAPSQRYPNVGEMWKALEAAAASGKTSPQGPGAPRPGAPTGAMARTLPLGSPNMPRPSPGIQKIGAGSPLNTTSKLMKPGPMKPAPNAPPGVSLSSTRPGGARPGPAPVITKIAVAPPANPTLRQAEEFEEEDDGPTRVGQSLVGGEAEADAPPDPGGKAGPGSGQDEDEEATRVRRPEDDVDASDNGAPPPPPPRPPPVTFPKDSERTLMMPPGGGGIPIPSAARPQAPPPPGAASQQLAPTSGGGLGSTVAFGMGPPVQPPPTQARPGMPGPPVQPMHHGQPMQPMQSAPFGAEWERSTTPAPMQSPPGLPAHFSHAHAPPHFQHSTQPQQPSYVQAAPAPQGQSKGPPVVLVVAAAAFLVIGIGGVAAFLTLGRAHPVAPTAASASVSAAPTPVPVPVEPSATPPSPAPTVPPAVDTGTVATADPVNAAPDTSASATNAATPPAVPTNAPTRTAPPANTGGGGATWAPPPKPKEAPPPPPPVDPNAWNESAARSRLSQANGVLAFCRKPDDPTGPGSATVTFAPDGSVTSVTVDPPYAGTKAGDCVVGQFKRARVNSFQGTPQTIKHPFVVPK